MKTKVQKWGNSLAVRIPKPYAEEIGLEPQTPVEVSVYEGSVVVTKVKSSSMMLEQLLQDISQENLHQEIDMGTAVGNEAW